MISDSIDEEKEALIPTQHLDYKESWSWSDKIEYAMKKEQIALKINQIVAVLSEVDTNVREKIDMSTRSIATTVSRKVSKGKVFNKVTLDSHHETYYGLREWFDEEKLHDDRMPKK